jgi:hypothetical protein
VTPLAYAQTAAQVSGELNATCQAAGFGAHDDNTIESKYGATETLAVVRPNNLVANRGTGLATKGDSGSPLVCNGLIVGTTVCTPGPGQEVYTRLDLSASFISSTVSGWACVTNAEQQLDQCLAAAPDGYHQCMCRRTAANTEYFSCGVGHPSTVRCRVD